MSKLKPIGSEKLKGQEQIKRILEIAKYKENIPNSINESSRTDFNTKLVDGNVYFIVKEKMGYTIKKGLNESTADYVEPMKNRKYFDSYAEAMKKLNLVAQELNRVNHVNEGISLFTEDKKYFLKTPKPETTDEAAPQTETPPPPPPPAPEEMPAPPAEDPLAGEGPDAPEGDVSPEDSMPDEPMGDEMPDEGPEQADDEIPTYKSIQKLTGKLAQKIRDFKGGDEEMSSKDAKYVVNSILSSLTDLLDDEDREDIITKLEDSEGDEDMGMEDEMPSDEMPSDEMPDEEMPAEDGEDTGEEMPTEEPTEMTEEEMNEKYVERALQSIFKESTVDKVLSKYFVINENEKKFTKNKKENKKNYLENKKNVDKQKIKQLSESLKQKNVATEIISSFPEMKFVGKTNLGNLVFEHNNKQLKVSPKGELL